MPGTPTSNSTPPPTEDQSAPQPSPSPISEDCSSTWTPDLAATVNWERLRELYDQFQGTSFREAVRLSSTRAAASSSGSSPRSRLSEDAARSAQEQANRTGRTVRLAVPRPTQLEMDQAVDPQSVFPAIDIVEFYPQTVPPPPASPWPTTHRWSLRRWAPLQTGTPIRGTTPSRGSTPRSPKYYPPLGP